MKNIDRMFKGIIIQGVATLAIVMCLIAYYENKISSLTQKHDESIVEMTNQQLSYQKDMYTYKYLYDTQEKDIKSYREKFNKVNEELTDLKNTIYLSKQRERGISRGDYATKNLSNYEIMTVDEMNEWIKQRAAKDSPFIGKGETFLKASAETGLDPKYIVAHAALESEWGKSDIAQIKNNYFGIGSFNATPFESSYTFDSGLDAGIMQGANWIKTNYFNKGRTTLNGMIYDGKAYCQLDDGSPDPNWITQITSIVYN